MLCISKSPHSCLKVDGSFHVPLNPAKDFIKYFAQARKMATLHILSQEAQHYGELQPAVIGKKCVLELSRRLSQHKLILLYTVFLFLVWNKHVIHNC